MPTILSLLKQSGHTFTKEDLWQIGNTVARIINAMPNPRDKYCYVNQSEIHDEAKGEEVFEVRDYAEHIAPLIEHHIKMHFSINSTGNGIKKDGKRPRIKRLIQTQK